MDLLRVSVRVDTADGEIARTRLLELAPAGFEEVETAGGSLELAVYTDAAGLASVRERFENVSATRVAAGWQDAWRSFHRPVIAGGVWIGPPWEVPPRGTPAVVIDPGLAFGTGAHATTRLCLELLARQPRGSLLDVGCGSGVLSLAAARLGFEPIVAVDVDPVAVEVTRANAVVNGVEIDCRVIDATIDPLPAAKVAVANVLLAPVERILGHLDAAVAVASGYLVGERPRHPGWDHIETSELDGWAADFFRRATV
jgi:ribosomal protein L11 methyltransferase